MIVHEDNGPKGILYHAVLSESKYKLQTKDLESIPPDSKLVMSSENLRRLESAHVYVVVSSNSGAGLAVTAFDDLLDPLLKQFSIKASVHKTSSKTSHREFLASALFSPDHENIIMLFGGDTIIYDLLNSLSENSHLSSSHRITICPIPCGTGNALAMSLKTTSIPIGISKALGVSGASVFTTAQLPLMKINIRKFPHEKVIWGAVVCSWGLHASLVADSDDPEMRRQYGAKRFAVCYLNRGKLINRLLQNVYYLLHHIFIKA